MVYAAAVPGYHTEVTVMAVVLHISGEESSHDWSLRLGSALASTLAQHMVPAVLILECESAGDAALFQELHPLAAKANMALLVSQPSQLLVSLRSALAQLSAQFESTLVVSLSPAPGAVLSAAASLRCATLRLSAADPAQASLAVLQHLAQLLRQQQPGCLVVGYVMKRSRQLSLLAEGMLPLMPVDGLCFMPLDITHNLASQQPFDILLQKPTDYLVEVPGSGSVPGFAPDMLRLHEQLGGLPRVCIVDPLLQVQGVMDRAALASLLDRVAGQARQAGVQLHSPRWSLVCQLETGLQQQQLAEAGLQLPLIVKPQVACGVAESHQMALLLHWDGLQGLEVPLPAVIQEYVDHGGLVWKAYVAGDKAFMTQRKSTPDLQPLVQQLAMSGQDTGIPTCIGFDSLKSLPTALPWSAAAPVGEPATSSASEGSQGRYRSRELRQGTVELLADLLRQQLQLTLFGFDVVSTSTGKLVVIDVNFFPSFKGISEAPKALRAALLARHREHLSQLKASA